MTNEIETLYQQIGADVTSLPKMDFLEVWLFVGVTEECVTSSVFCKDTNRKLHKLSTYPDGDLILDLWEASRKRGDNWDEMTFHVTREGDFDVSFEYDVPFETLHDFDRPNQWVSKNLGDVEIITHLPPSLSDD